MASTFPPPQPRPFLARLRRGLSLRKRSDYLRGQPRGEWLLSELLNKITAKKKQQLISDQQDGERYRQHAHAQQFACGYICGQRPLERRVDRRNPHSLHEYLGSVGWPRLPHSRHGVGTFGRRTRDRCRSCSNNQRRQ
jgi:hypothetical protein